MIETHAYAPSVRLGLNRRACWAIRGCGSLVHYERSLQFELLHQCKGQVVSSSTHGIMTGDENLGAYERQNPCKPVVF